MKRLLILPVLLLTLLVGTPAFSADFQKGWDAHESGDFATALREWTPLAKQGNAVAQFYLGMMYSKGQGVPEDDKTAVKWYTLAAEQGNAFAQFYLGLMYRNGWGVPQDYKTAVKWYRLAAEQGDELALSYLVAMAAAGNVVAQSNLKKIKTRFVSKGIDECLFDEIAKVTGPETKNIVENYCRRKMEKKSLDWLLRYAD